MINIAEVKETNDMIEKENLDVRTITLGISLLNCIDDNLEKLNEKISENSFIGYGGKYKFTFAKVNNDYVYTSTSYINS